MDLNFEWEKLIVYFAIFLALWFVLITPTLNPQINLQLGTYVWHIHHSTLGLAIIALAFIFEEITKKRYDWIFNVLLALGVSLLMHHILTEGAIFIS